MHAGPHVWEAAHAPCARTKFATCMPYQKGSHGVNQKTPMLTMVTLEHKSIISARMTVAHPESHDMVSTSAPVLQGKMALQHGRAYQAPYFCPISSLLRL